MKPRNGQRSALESGGGGQIKRRAHIGMEFIFILFKNQKNIFVQGL